jgi:hypothetical protein
VYGRVVRFTGVNAEWLEELLVRIKESTGPPEGVPTTGLRILLLDKDQGTAVVEQYFETAVAMELGGQASSIGSVHRPAAQTDMFHPGSAGRTRQRAS